MCWEDEFAAWLGSDEDREDQARRDLYSERGDD